MKNLTEISSALAHRYPEITNKKALEISRFVVACMIKGMTELAPDSRDRLVIAEFGNFAVKKTQERTVQNITTKEKVTVPAGVRIVFKATDNLKNIVKSGEYEIPAPGEAPAEEAAPADAAPKAKREKKAAAAAEATEAAEAGAIDPNNIPDISDL
jgi:nucleoid DNA-binding protein